MADEQETNRPGKRYTCATCGCQVICNKGGPGHITCHGVPMAMEGAKPLPSTD